jgi:mannosyltransferase
VPHAAEHTDRPALRQAWIGAGLAAIVGVSVLLRVGTMDIGYGIDEAISVGIASHDLGDIPGTLRLDSSPPLYYLLLHEWMALFGTGEAATRTLSLLFALAAIPVAWWAGRALFGVRGAWLAAAGAAGCPFLTRYAQETRMYSLVVLLSLVACAAFALAFLHGRRVHLVTLAVALTLLLYTHDWALFLAAGMGVVWLGLWRRGTVGARDGPLVAAVVLALYAPWVPSLIFQARHTGAPWAQPPSALLLLGFPGQLLGEVAVVLLALPAVELLRRRGPGYQSVCLLLVLTGAVAVLAWLSSQLEPAWTPRYLAVLLGPLLLAVAGGAVGGRWTTLALVGVAVAWALTSPPAVKSDARDVTRALPTQVGGGDVVACTLPELVPVVAHYLPAGLSYVTPIGPVADPGVTDWRDGMDRMRAGGVQRDLEPAVAALAAGHRLVLVTPVLERPRGPWLVAVARRTREWRAALRRDRRLRAIGSVGARTPRPNAVRAEFFVKV